MGQELYWVQQKNEDRNKTLSIKEYLNEIKPYLKDIINNLKKSDAWKIQLTISINFYFSKDLVEAHVMHLKSDIIKFMIYDNEDEVIEELLESLVN